MPRYFIQNKLGQYLTGDALWTGDKILAAGFDDLRGLLKVCERERIHDAQLVIDFCDDRDSTITVPIQEMNTQSASTRNGTKRSTPWRSPFER